MADWSISNDAVLKATGVDWESWMDRLDNAGAAALPHNEIALLIQSKWKTSEWWGQMITVEFEQFIGRRVPGQTCTGDFQMGCSKTMPGDLDSVLALWCDYVSGWTSCDGVLMSDEPKITTSEKWRYWRVGLQDGTRVAVAIGSKGDDKCSLAINHEKLASADDVAAWQRFWKSELDRLVA